MLTREILTASWRHWLLRRTPPAGPRWLFHVWPLVYAAAVAVPFTLLGFALYADGEGAWRNVAGWVEWYGRNYLVSLVITYCILLASWLGRRLLGAARIDAMAGWQRSVYFTAMPCLGVAVGWPLGFAVQGGNFSIFAQMNANGIASSVLVLLLGSWGFHTYFTLRQREIEAQMCAREAQLQLLQAQIEPHFLFNTLANVICMIEADPPQARRTLEAFTDYLRASLGNLRRQSGSLAAEFELAERYLCLMQARMGDRLRFALEADAAARAAQLPPLLLQPLVENAVQHGLEPRIAGGRVAVVARVLPPANGAPARLEVCVEDDGSDWDGAAPPRSSGARRGTGMALENIRARLAAQFGAAAALRLEPLHPGTRARLTLPYLPEAAAAAAPGGAAPSAASATLQADIPR